ncbi:hypothetical protein KIN20_026491 [Parelaphostrongylus tenuis]|nr:hypothetical protein KIN20_026491 [Parelaphostrongylus tenuis]
MKVSVTIACNKLLVPENATKVDRVSLIIQQKKTAEPYMHRVLNEGAETQSTTLLHGDLQEVFKEV